jgi:hypothetical protein
MNDADLIREFIRTVPGVSAIVIEVRMISWPHPHEPESAWITAAELPSGASQDRVGKAVRKLLKDRKYFRVCQECKERNPVGWTHDSKICQSCAERNHGVCY